MTDLTIHAFAVRTETQYIRADHLGGRGSWKRDPYGDNPQRSEYRINTTSNQIYRYYGTAFDTYTTAYHGYNHYGVAGKSVETNTLSNDQSRYILSGYRHDTDIWVLNQPTTTRVSRTDAAYTTVSEITYHGQTLGNARYAAYALPYETKSFATWTKRFSDYHFSGDAKGSIKTIEFNEKLIKANGSKSTKYRSYQASHYMRGKPQTIRLPARYNDTGSMSSRQVVDPNGWVKSVTDFNGTTTYYHYDALGRIQSMDAPDPWIDRLFVWSVSAAGKPVRTVRKCILATRSRCAPDTLKLQTTTLYDGLFRPLIVNSEDVVNNEYRYTRSRFNAYGKATFTSYPSSTLPIITSTSGFSMVYDGLQRLQTTSQSGGGTQSIYYENDNKRRVNDFKGNDTTTTYLAYGAPSYHQALKIASPENVTTSMVIDVLGHTHSITQTGMDGKGAGTVSQTQYHVYNHLKQLCKTVRKDVGTTAYHRNVLGEILWQAQGVSNTQTDTCTSGVAPVRQIKWMGRTFLVEREWTVIISMIWSTNLRRLVFPMSMLSIPKNGLEVLS